MKTFSVYGINGVISILGLLSDVVGDNYFVELEVNLKFASKEFAPNGDERNIGVLSLILSKFRSK